MWLMTKVEQEMRMLIFSDEYEETIIILYASSFHRTFIEMETKKDNDCQEEEQQLNQPNHTQTE